MRIDQFSLVGSDDSYLLETTQSPLHSLTDSGDIRDPTPSPTHIRRRAQTMPSSRHKRFKSDLTGMKFHQPDLPSSPSPSVTPTPHEKEPFDWPEGEDGGVVREEEGFTLPTIDVEVDFTFNVDHGKIVLRTEER